MTLLIQPNPVALSLLIPATICGSLALYTLLSRPVTGSRAFALLMLAVFIWSVAYGLELSCITLEWMLFFVGLEYIGIVSIPVLWLVLTLQYSGRERWVTTRNVALLFIIPVMTLALNITNKFHYLYYSSVSVDSAGHIPLLAITAGPWYFMFFAYYYLCVFLGTALLILRLRHPALIYRRQVIAMLVGVAVPWIVNILYLAFNVRPMGHLDMTPYAFTFTGIVIAWGMFRYRLFDVAPVARDLVIEDMGDGMVVLDMQDRIVDANRSAQHIFQWSKSPYGQSVKQALCEWPFLLELTSTHKAHSTELVQGGADNKQYYEISLSELKDRQGFLIGWLLLMHDLTIRKRAQEALRQQEEKYQLFFKTSRDTIFITSVDGHWLDTNDAAAEMLGYESTAEMKKVPVLDIYHDKQRRSEYIGEMIKNGFTHDFPAVLQKKNGDLIDVLITSVVVRDDKGNITAFQGTLKDITAIKRTEAALLLANEQLTVLLSDTERRNREITLMGEMAQLIHASRDLELAYSGAARYLAELFKDDSGIIAEVNNHTDVVEVKATFGSPAGARVFNTQDCHTLVEGKIYEYDGSDQQKVCSHLGSYSGFYTSIPLIVPGDFSWILSLQSTDYQEYSILSGREWLDLRRPLLVSVGQELALAFANVRLRENLREQAIRDPLTGLYNRRYMEEMSERELHRAMRGGKGAGFIMGDIDHFKAFNDSYGHEVGDMLLKAIASLLQANIRVEDIACRYGGEEFLIILPSASLQDAYKRALNIHDEVEKITFKHNNRQISDITISLGVSAFPDQGDTVPQLIAAADAAMYKAKREGRNRVCLP